MEYSVVYLQLQLVPDIQDPVVVAVEHGEEVLSLPVGDLQLGDGLHGLLELHGVQGLLVEHMVLKVIYVREEVLTRPEFTICRAFDWLKKIGLLWNQVFFVKGL